MLDSEYVHFHGRDICMELYTSIALYKPIRRNVWILKKKPVICVNIPYISNNIPRGPRIL